MKRCQFHLIHKGSARKMMNLNYQGSNNKTLNFEECDMGLNEDTKEENRNACCIHNYETNSISFFDST